MPSRLQPGDPQHPHLAVRGVWVVIFVVLAGLTVSLLDTHASLSLPFVSQVAAMGLLYLTLTLALGDRISSQSHPALLGTYFAVQLAVLATLAAMFAGRGMFNMEWLLFMPLLVYGRMLLPPAGSLVIAAASLTIIALHLQHLAGWSGVPGPLFAIATSVAFVLLFTDIAMRESDGRAQSQRLGEALEQANRRLSAYAVQAEELASARERTRMAREIHDSVGHSLTAVNMQLEAARTMLDHNTDKSRDALDKAQRCLKDGLAEIRASVAALRADPLDGRGLHESLADLVDLSSDSGLPAQLQILGQQRPLTQDASLALFRCAQEGLTNARKHSRASRVELVLDYTDDESVRFHINDDGIGADSFDGGFGLLGLKERAQQLGGQFHIQSNPGRGLSLEIEIPTLLAHPSLAP